MARRRPAAYPPVEIGGRRLDPSDVRLQAGRPFHQLRVGNLELAGLCIQRLDRGPGVHELLLGVPLPRLGRLPLIVPPGDGLPRLGLLCRLGLTLFAGPAILVTNQFTPPGQSRVLIVPTRKSELCFEQLLLARVLVPLQRLQLGLYARGVGVKRVLIFDETAHRSLLGHLAHAKLLELAAEAQDSAFLRTTAAAHQRRAVKYGSVRRHDCVVGGAGRRRGRFE